MNTYESEQEQLEALQKWWKENGRAVAFGVLLGAAAIGGWSSWQVYTARQAEKASLHYEQLLHSIDSNAYEEAIERGSSLAEEFPNSGYATLASLVIARAAFDRDDVEEAKTYLRRAIGQGGPEAVRQIARLRLARLLADEGKWEEAKTLLGESAGEFGGLYEEMRGDVLLAQGNPAEARSAYEKSSAEGIAYSGQSQARVRIKTDDLGKADLPGSEAPPGKVPEAE